MTLTAELAALRDVLREHRVAAVALGWSDGDNEELRLYDEDDNLVWPAFLALQQRARGAAAELERAARSFERLVHRVHAQVAQAQAAEETLRRQLDAYGREPTAPAKPANGESASGF